MREERIAVTVRFPRELIARAKALKNGAGSFNDLVVSAVEAELQRRDWQQTLKRIDDRAERILRERGPLSDSRQLIRDLREGIGRRD